MLPINTRIRMVEDNTYKLPAGQMGTIKACMRAGGVNYYTIEFEDGQTSEGILGSDFRTYITL